MTVFVDTSAFLAVLDAGDANHTRAAEAWVELVQRGTTLVCTNYVLVETFALVQHRLGLEAVRSLQEDVLPVVQVTWVDEATHLASITALLEAGRKQLSLVDCVSFESMRRLGIATALAFDRHFAEHGFTVIP